MRKSLLRSEKRGKSMASKRVVMIIVEGPTDDEALGLLFTRFFDQNQVYIQIVHGDITSSRHVNAQNIQNKITDFVKENAKKYAFKQSDIQEVIQITDTDGAFIPDSQVVFDNGRKRPFYTTSQILCAHPDRMIQRNHQKSQNLRRLSALTKIWRQIPYHIFYMSSNLDHVLYNKLNSTNEEKEDNAFYFAKKYKERLEDFIIFMTESDFSVCGDYKASWAFIQEGNRSLERHSNLGILLERHHHQTNTAFNSN